MKRLTNLETLTNGLSSMPIVKIENQIQANQKLFILEEIEEEIGLDLITLFKALKNGIYVESEDNITTLVELTYEPKNNGNEWQFNYTWNFKDCGKTWALTKEELESEY